MTAQQGAHPDHSMPQLTKATPACFNGGLRMEDHFVDITEMIGIGIGGLGLQPGELHQRPCVGELPWA